MKNALVTGDADILEVAEAFSVPILSPAAFQQRLSCGEGTDG